MGTPVGSEQSGAGTSGAAAKPAVNMKLAMGAMVCTLLAVVMIVVSMVTPWYMTSTTGGGFTATSNSDFSGTTVTFGGNTTKQTWENYTNEYKGEHNGTAPQLPGVYSMTMYMLVGGMVFALLGIVTGFMVGKGKLPPMAPMVVAILALLLTVGAFGAFLSMHPGAMKSDIGSDVPPFDGPWNSFAGSTSQGGATVTWGGALGYWLPLVAALFIIVGMVLGMRSMKGAPKADAAAPPAPPM